MRIRFLGDEARITRLSLIDETGERYVRMAHLACVGSHAINGVAELHSELLKSDVLKDFYEMWPQKFSNKTNGVTPRRWMVLCNPKLSELITEHIGDGWIKDSEPAQSPRTSGRERRIPRPLARHQAPANKAWRHARCCGRESSSIQIRCSMSWSSAFTSTSASI